LTTDMNGSWYRYRSQLSQPVTESFANQIFHNKVVTNTPISCEVSNFYNVVMTNSTRCSGFTLEPLNHPWILMRMLKEHFQGKRFVESDVLDLVNCTKPTLTHALQYAVSFADYFSYQRIADVGFVDQR